jgi:hypothetical protein
MFTKIGFTFFVMHVQFYSSLLFQYLLEDWRFGFEFYSLFRDKTLAEMGARKQGDQIG